MIEDVLRKYTKYVSQASDLQNESAYYVNRDSENPFKNTFRNKVLAVYNGNEHQTNRFFEAFLGDPVPSLEVCNTIFTNLFKVFDSQNQNEQYNFTNSSYKQEAEQYLKRFENWWKTEYWEAIKTQFNSLIVVDLPRQQKGTSPEPYFYVLDISRVCGIIPDKDWNIEEIVFNELVEVEEDGKKVEKEYFYWFTKEFYSKWEKSKETNVYINIFQESHTMGENPCFFLWPDKLNKTSWVLRKGILVSSHDDLKWYNIKYVESRKADMLYLNPTLQRPRQNCGYSINADKAETGKIECNNGWLMSSDGTLVIRNGSRQLCPVCGKARHSGGGAGQTIEIDFNAMPENFDPSKPLSNWITPEVEGTELQYQRVIDLKDSLIESNCGTEQPETREALNEKQVTSNKESKEDVLKRLASFISYAVENTYRRVLKLKFKDKFISCSFFQGSEFYLKTIKDLIDLRGKAYNPIVKTQIDEQIIEVKYRNPEKLSEEKLLYKLLPYSSLTDVEFGALCGTRINDEKTISLRFQFSDAVMLFESKYGSIYEYYNGFSETIPEFKRLEAIKELLISLIKIEKNVIQDQISKPL